MSTEYSFRCTVCAKRNNDHIELCVRCYKNGYRFFQPQQKIHYGEDIQISKSQYETFLINMGYAKPSIPLAPEIRDVIFKKPATIVFWADGTKTVVKAKDELFDPEKGLAMAICKKAMGNKGNYYNQIKKWVSHFKANNNADT